MSRRDTILFIVLINTGLLVVLFSLAMGKEPGTTTIVKQQQPYQEQPVFDAAVQLVQEEAAVPKKEKVVATSDEVDQLLAQLAARSYSGTQTAKQEAPAPKKVEKAPTKASSEGLEVTVKRGDVLDRIAQNNGVSVEDIMKHNDLSSTNIQVGQVLRIPVVAKKSVEKKSTVAAVPSRDDEQYYTVRSGDTPWHIAMRHRINLQDLLELNNLDEDSARSLRPGDKLRIR